MEAPTAIVGGLGDRVAMLRTERTRATRNGGVEGAGEYTDWDVQAVSRAVGYRSTALPDLPFDAPSAVIPNEGGPVLDLDGVPIPGTDVTGWIKRGPVGLIGHTKSDAAETVGHLLAEPVPTATARAREAVDAYLAERGVEVATFASWERIDWHEIALGEAAGRARIKLASREEMLRVGRRNCRRLPRPCSRRCGRCLDAFGVQARSDRARRSQGVRSASDVPPSQVTPTCR